MENNLQLLQQVWWMRLENVYLQRVQESERSEQVQLQDLLRQMQRQKLYQAVQIRMQVIPYLLKLRKNFNILHHLLNSKLRKGLLCNYLSSRSQCYLMRLYFFLLLSLKKIMVRLTKFIYPYPLNQEVLYIAYKTMLFLI